MKVLVISHTVFSKSSNMGKTLLSYFSQFDKNEIAQLYVHSEVPTEGSICTSYYRFTDIDALKSIFIPWHKGKKFDGDDVQTDQEITRIDKGIVSKAYALGTKRQAWTICVRDLIWKLSRWNNVDLKNWISDIQPDIIFLACGEFGFIYNLGRVLADYLNKPLVVACVDDHFLQNRNTKEFLGKYNHRRFMKIVHKTMKRTSAIFTISDKMNLEYGCLFNKKCYTLHTSAEKKVLNFNPQAKEISYIGNLGYGRCEQLVILGKTLNQYCCKDNLDRINVYSSTRNKKYIEMMKNADGICFKGTISSEEVLKVMENSIAVIHVESFDKKMQELTKYSVSTKIAESLLYGPCLFAYGPEEIASIEYLKNMRAAYVITSEMRLREGVLEFLSDASLRNEIVDNARRLAKQNHTTDVNSKKLRKWLEDIVNENACIQGESDV